MKIAFFGAKAYDRAHFNAANSAAHHQLHYLEPRLSPQTVKLAEGFRAVCAFVNDDINAEVVAGLAGLGVQLIALRCAGFNNVDLAAAQKHGLTVVRVPAYSPYAVAEFAVGMMLTLNRKYHKAFNRVREGNFAIDGLAGFDLFGKTVGVVGTGRIGVILVRILLGFGCKVLVFDVAHNVECQALGAEQVAFEEVLRRSDILSLHCPLTPQTHYLINERTLALMKPGAMLINTSRGGLIDTAAVIAALKEGTLGWLGMDVYEEEEGVFFEDLSGRVLGDDLLARLLTFPNVLITGHQAFLTDEALTNIAQTTLANVEQFERGEPCPNRCEPSPGSPQRKQG